MKKIALVSLLSLIASTNVFAGSVYVDYSFKEIQKPYVFDWDKAREWKINVSIDTENKPISYSFNIEDFVRGRITDFAISTSGSYQQVHSFSLSNDKLNTRIPVFAPAECLVKITNLHRLMVIGSLSMNDSDIPPTLEITHCDVVTW